MALLVSNSSLTMFEAECDACLTTMETLQTLLLEALGRESELLAKISTLQNLLVENNSCIVSKQEL